MCIKTKYHNLLWFKIKETKQKIKEKYNKTKGGTHFLGTFHLPLTSTPLYLTPETLNLALPCLSLTERERERERERSR